MMLILDHYLAQKELAELGRLDSNSAQKESQKRDLFWTTIWMLQIVSQKWSRSRDHF